MNKKSLIESIGYQEIKKIIHFKVKEGSDLFDAIEEIVNTQKISEGIFISGIGALKKAVFRNIITIPKEYPIKDDNRLYLKIEAPLELVSLTGWISPKENSPAEFHCHFSASTVKNEGIITLGGHLTKGTIAGIKVVIAIAEVKPGSSKAQYDPYSKSLDITF